MIDTRNRLVKLAKRSASYEQFEQHATNMTRWYYRPWLDMGTVITHNWLKVFYSTIKGRTVYEKD